MFQNQKPELAAIQPDTSELGERPKITLETAAARVASWTDLTPEKRRDLTSALKAVRRIHERGHALKAETHGRQDSGTMCPPTIIDCISLRGILHFRTPAAFGLRKARFTNICSLIRDVMRRLDLHAEGRRGRAGLAPAWCELLQALPDYHSLGLGSFVRFCSDAETDPGQVNETDLIAFEHFLVTRTLVADPAKQRGMALRMWNNAMRTVPGWPQRHLVIPAKRVPYTLPIDAYPPSFQEDVAVFERNCCGSTAAADIFSDDIFGPGGTGPQSRKRAARPATVKARLFQIRLAAAALIRSGMAPDSLTTLRDLVQPVTRVRTILSFFYDRSDQQLSSMTAGVGELLRQLAKYHCGLPDKDAALIAEWAKRMMPQQQSTMTEKNQRKLHALSVPRNQAMLLHLPARLLKQAIQAEATTPAIAARLAMRACAIELLTICPMRLKNLGDLQMNLHLVKDDGKQRYFSRLRLDEQETKNHASLEWPLPPATAKLLDDYIKRFRPLQTDASNPFLFPGKAGGRLSKNAMAAAISEPIDRMIGIPVNPHLMRHFAAYTFLKRHPGEYEITRRILGHKSIETTIKFYCGLEAEFAAEKFDQTVLQERRRSKLTAAASFGRQPPARIRKGH